MKMWPLSVVRESPMLPSQYVGEIYQTYSRIMSEPAFNACLHVARYTQAIETPQLIVVENVDTPARRLYLDYPELDEWLRLERGAVFEGSNGFLYVHIDALH